MYSTLADTNSKPFPLKSLSFLLTKSRENRSIFPSPNFASESPNFMTSIIRESPVIKSLIILRDLGNFCEFNWMSL